MFNIPLTRKLNNQLLLDYGYHTTVPIAGEKLADSWFARWYTRQLIKLSFNVRRSIPDAVGRKLISLSVGRASGFYLMAC